MKKIIGILSLLILTAWTGLNDGHDHNLCKGFLPNDITATRPINSLNPTGISETDFHWAISRLEQIYKPIVQSHGAELKVERLWDNEDINAYAQQKKDILGKQTYKVAMYGGLARHEDVTVDGFIMVICHEFGHHLGGAAKKSRIGAEWASSEGQSDYYASLKCFRKVYTPQENEIWFNEQGGFDGFEPHLINSCQKSYSDFYNITLCLRTAAAGQSLANMMGALRKVNQPNMLTPDEDVVCENDDSHPAAQCRLDTYIQGALCKLGDTTQLSDKDANKGTCNRLAGDTNGVRPLCWYKPAHTEATTNCKQP